jgi:hypothetical protein
MKKELDEALCKKYPKIFRDRHAPMNQTCMCWGFDIGDGWYNIVDALCSLIQNRIDYRKGEVVRNMKYLAVRKAALAGDWTAFDAEHAEQAKTHPDWVEQQRKALVGPIPDYRKSKPIPQVVAVQVKEKFGTLRFYINGGDEAILHYIEMAEAMSAHTCEECGQPGKLRSGGWIRTLCDDHKRESDDEQEENEKLNAEIDAEFAEEEAKLDAEMEEFWKEVGAEDEE